MKKILYYLAEYIMSEELERELEIELAEEKRIKEQDEKEKIENQKSEFQTILFHATSILQSNNEEKQSVRIYDLILSLGKEHQFKIINNLIKGKKNSIEDRDIEKLFFKNYSYKLYSFNQETNNEKNINKMDDKAPNYVKEKLGRTLHPQNSLIFTYPWDGERLNSAFLNIGKNVGNPWKHDDYNHTMTLIEPLNIGVITCGNHSSAINIMCNESPIKITHVLDLTPVYNDIYTDGYFFYFKADNSIISEATSVEFAAIFEIGRLLNNPIYKKFDI